MSFAELSSTLNWADALLGAILGALLLFLGKAAGFVEVDVGTDARGEGVECFGRTIKLDEKCVGGDALGDFFVDAHETVRLHENVGLEFVKARPCAEFGD